MAGKVARKEISSALQNVVSPLTVMKKGKNQIVKNVIEKPKKLVKKKNIDEEAIRKIEKKIEECRLRKADLLEKKKEMVRELRKAGKKAEVAINKEVTKADLTIKKEVKKADVVINKEVKAEIKNKEVKEAEISKKVKKEADLNKEAPQIIDLGFQNGFFDKYEPLRIIGKGGFGLVFKAMDRNDGHLVAVKVFPRSKISQAGGTFLKREVAILEALNGLPSAVRFDGAYQSDKGIFLVMELLEGGDMNQKLNSPNRGGVCAESEAKKWMKSVLSALEGLHGKNIAHRDLKLENIMFGDSEEDVKLVDFGLSDYVASGGSGLSELAGTPGYIAPEVFDGEGGLASDMWSLGVIAHLLLTGEFPFPDPADQSDRYAWRPNMKFGPDYSDEAVWGNVSHQARDFVKALLNPDPNLRVTVSQAKCHHWFTHKDHQEDLLSQVLVMHHHPCAANSSSYSCIF